MRRRLVALSLAITSMVVIAFVVPLGLLVRDLAADRATTPAQLRAQALAPLVGLADAGALEVAIEVTRQSVSGTVHVVTPDGRRYGDEPFPSVPEGRAGVVVLPSGDRVAVVPVVDASGAGVVAITISQGELRKGVREAWALLSLLGVMLVVGAAWLTDRLARSTTDAMDKIEATARRLSSGDLTARTAVDDPIEVARIATALNELAERTGELLSDERERAADLSHGLRTPLTALRLDAEALDPSPARDRVVDDIEAIEVAVDEVIRQARRPVREGGTRRCDLQVVVSDRLAWWGALAVDEGREVRSSVPLTPVWVKGSVSDFTTVVDGLVGNVFSHTEHGVGLTVSLTVGSGQATFTVQDDGPGFPDDVDVLARGVSGAGSTGLGLAIVVETVQAAGGTVTLDAGASRVVLDIPTVAGPR